MTRTTNSSTKTLIAAVALCTCALGSAAVHAQTNVSPPSKNALTDDYNTPDTRFAQPQGIPPHDRDELSPGAAVAFSLLGTVAGYGTFIGGASSEHDGLAYLGLAGILVGPSLGHLYTGEHRKVWLTGGLRGLGIVGMGVGGTIALRDCGLRDSCDSGGPPLFWISAIVTVGATVYSIVDSASSARRVNERRRNRLALTPTPIVGPNQSTGMGMSLSGTF